MHRNSGQLFEGSESSTYTLAVRQRPAIQSPSLNNSWDSVPIDNPILKPVCVHTFLDPSCSAGSAGSVTRSVRCAVTCARPVGGIRSSRAFGSGVMAFARQSAPCILYTDGQRLDKGAAAGVRPAVATMALARLLASLAAILVVLGGVAPHSVKVRRPGDLT